MKNHSPSKQPGNIQSFFQKAAEKQKEKVRKNVDEEDDGVSSTGFLPPLAVDSQVQTDQTNCPASPSKIGSGSPHSGISSFFHKKNLERNLKVPVSAMNQPETEQTNGGSVADCVAAVSGTQPKNRSDFTPHQSLCEELKDEQDVDPDFVPHPTSVAREDLLKCERCGQDVLVWEMPEHNDYHFAMDLQKSLSSPAGSEAVPSSFSSPSGGSLTPVRAGAAQSSRGKTKTRGQSGPAPKRPRSQGGSTGTLDSFFKRS